MQSNDNTYNRLDFQHVFRDNPSVVILVDVNWNVVSINKTGSILFGKNEKEIIGSPLSSLIECLFPTNAFTTGMCQNCLCEHISTMFGLPFKETKSTVCDMCFVQNGKQLKSTMIFSSSIVQTASNELLMLHFENITEKRKVDLEFEKAKKNAEESEKLKTNFLANINHEIRTPLNGIVGFSNLLSELLTDNKEGVKYLDFIQRNTDKLLTIFNNMLLLSQLQSGSYKLKNELLDIESILHEIHGEFKEQTQHKNIEFAYINSSSSTIRLVSDRYYIKSALRCLVDNAVKYTFSGQIQLGYYIDHVRNNAVFFVEDTGIGISKESQKFIFDKFYQVDSSLSRKFEGGGLGLTMVKEVSKIFNGEIEVNSIPGVGTCVKFLIPLQHSFQQAETPSVNLVQSSEPKKKLLHILIAEDEEINLFLLEEILMREKFMVTCVRDGEEAVNFVANNKDIDVILMDIKMPVLDGIEATKMIKQLAPDIPIIAQTAYTSQDHGGRIDGAGFASIINKPVNHFELIEHIKLVSMHSPN